MLPTWNTTYFDDRLPFVKDGNSDYLLDVDTSTWFTELDTGDSLRYTLTYSDSTTRPNWLGFDLTTGILRGFPSADYPSELLNL